MFIYEHHIWDHIIVHVSFKLKILLKKDHPGGVHNLNSCDHNSNVGPCMSGTDGRSSHTHTHTHTRY